MSCIIDRRTERFKRSGDQLLWHRRHHRLSDQVLEVGLRRLVAGPARRVHPAARLGVAHDQVGRTSQECSRFLGMSLDMFPEQRIPQPPVETEVSMVQNRYRSSYGCGYSSAL